MLWNPLEQDEKMDEESEAVGFGTCAMLSCHQPALDDLIGADGDDMFTIYLAVVGKSAEE